MKRAQPLSLPVRAILLPMPGKSADAQRDLAAKAGAKVYYAAGQRDAWLRALQPGQFGWLWRLSWLAVPAGGDVLPIADYAGVIADLSRRIGEGARVIQGDGAVCSDDKAAWLQAVSVGALQVRSGRRITSDDARERGEGGRNAMIERSAVNLLRTSHKHKLALVRRYWRSEGTRLARADAINAELEAAGLARLGSWQTISRALKQLDE